MTAHRVLNPRTKLPPPPAHLRGESSAPRGQTSAQTSDADAAAAEHFPPHPVAAPHAGPRRLRVGAELSVLCQTLDANGCGVGSAMDAGRRGAAETLAPAPQVHVPNLLPGERAYVKVVHVSPHVGRAGERAEERMPAVSQRPAFARLLRRDNAAPERQIPACGAFGFCGGCTLQHLRYEAQLEFKQRLLQEQLGRVAAEVGVDPCVPSPQPLHYRSRVKLVAAPAAAPAAASQPGTGRIVLGAYAPRSHHVIDLSGCQVNTLVLRQVARTLSEKWSAAGLSVYEEESGRGALRYVLLRVVHSGAVQVSLVVAETPPRPRLLEVVAALQAAHPQLASVVLHHNSDPGNALLTAADGSEEPIRPAKSASAVPPLGAEPSLPPPGPAPKDEVLLGSDFLYEDLGAPGASAGAELRVRISARSFLQVNREVASRIYADVATALPASAGETILDLYCGVGALGRTVLAARAAARLIGIESNPSAVADAEHSARQAGLSADQARFVCGAVEAVLPELFPAGLLRPPLLVLLNPPRRGCTDAVLQQVVSLAPRAIGYVSCNPQSLARDLGHLLAAGYKLRRVTPYDMHPGTPHIETVALLERTGLP